VVAGVARAARQRDGFVEKTTLCSMGSSVPSYGYAGLRSRDRRPSGDEAELQHGERIGTLGVERLEVG
jgi:hypothetical protein